jgi:hypothetical protein
MKMVSYRTRNATLLVAVMYVESAAQSSMRLSK